VRAIPPPVRTMRLRWQRVLPGSRPAAHSGRAWDSEKWEERPVVWRLIHSYFCSCIVGLIGKELSCCKDDGFEKITLEGIAAQKLHRQSRRTDKRSEYP